jgi:hypothetical protein
MILWLALNSMSADVLGDDTRTVERHYGWLQPHKSEINGAFT